MNGYQFIKYSKPKIDETENFTLRHLRSIAFCL